MIKNNLRYLFFTISIGLIFFVHKGFGQSYTFSPSKIYTINVDTSQNNFGGIEVQNTGSQNLNLTWRSVLTDTLIDSYFQLCNSGICFLNLPNSGVMPTIIPGDIGWIKFHMFSGRTNGVNTIKYTLKNGSIQSDTLTFIINVVGGITAIKDLNNIKDHVLIYPNPTSNEAQLQITLLESSDVSISVFNTIGQDIHHSISNYNTGVNSVNLDVKDYPSGIYTLIISTKNGVITKKITVTK